jgi:hypothetical protein
VVLAAMEPSPAADGSVECSTFVGCKARASVDGNVSVPFLTAPLADRISELDTSNTDTPSEPDPCPWSEVENLGLNSSWWAGNDPTAGHIEINACAAGNSNAPGGGIVQTRFVPNGDPTLAAAPPPPTPEQLAQQAIADLVVPEPLIGIGPEPTKLAVNLWTWLWVDESPPVAVTAAAGGVSVTATATLTSTTWSLGEPATTGGEFRPGPAATVTCAGTGSAPPPDYDWKAEPPCGHMFAWRSLKERTGGTGKWPITATTNWAVAWQSNTGAAGTDALTATSADQFDVGEYRIVLVKDPGG